MILCLLQDVQSSFASNWARVANLPGLADIHIGDRFREQGVGPGGEELEVAGVDISPVGGFSRLFFNRGANATQPEVHRLGAVLEPVGILVRPIGPPIDGGTFQPIEIINVPSAAHSITNSPTNGSASAESLPPPEGVKTEPLVPLKRGRGRPAGSKNKAKQEVVLPVGFQ